MRVLVLFLAGVCCCQGEKPRELNLVNPIPKNVSKYLGPVAAGVVGAGALAGVIAVSVMHKPTTTQAAPKLRAKTPKVDLPGPYIQKVTTMSTPSAAGATTVGVVNQGGFHIGDAVIIDQGTPQQEVNHIASFGSLVFQTPLKFPHAAGASVATVPPNQGAPQLKAAAAATPTEAPGTSSGSIQGDMVPVAIGGAVLGLCLICMCAAGVIYSMSGKKQKKRKVPTRDTYMPEENQPMMQPSLEPAPESQYLVQSQYMPVGAPPGIGQMPTLDVVPMQTMPPTMFNQPLTTGFAAASPLAQTQNAVLPTTAMATQFNQVMPAAGYGGY